MQLFLHGLGGVFAVLSLLVLIRQELKGDQLKDAALPAYAIALFAYLLNSGAIARLLTKG
jgi:hypothetical protein